MKSIVSSVEIVSSRVRFLLISSFTALMLVASIGLSGCGSGSSGGGGGDTPERQAEPAFDTSSADSRYMIFDMAASASASVSKAVSGGVEGGTVVVTNASGEEIESAWSAVEGRDCAVVVSARAGFCEDISVALKFTGCGVDEVVPVTVGPNPLDAKGDCRADHAFINPYFQCLPPDGEDFEIRDLCGSFGYGEAIFMWGAEIAAASGTIDISRKANLPRTAVPQMRSALAVSGQKLGDPSQEYDVFTMGDMRNIGDFNGDGKADFILTASGSYVRSMSILGMNGNVPQIFAYAGGDSEDSSPALLSGIGDVNGDGLADLFLVIEGKDGTVFALLLGDPDLSGELSPEDVIVLSLPDEMDNWEKFGFLVAEGIGNVNGDKVTRSGKDYPLNDFAISFLKDSKEDPELIVVVYEGSENAAKLAASDWVIESPENGSGSFPTRLFGAAIAGGDVDGAVDEELKMHSEILVGAPSVTSAAAGLVYMYAKDEATGGAKHVATFSSLASAEASAAKAADQGPYNPRVQIALNSPEKGFGAGVAVADIFGDGASEVIIGSPLEGLIRAFSGRLDASAEPAEIGADQAIASFTAGRARLGAQMYAYLEGYAIRNMGDIDNDGIEDLSIFGNLSSVGKEKKPGAIPAPGLNAFMVADEDSVVAGGRGFAFILFGDSSIPEKAAASSAALNLASLRGMKVGPTNDRASIDPMNAPPDTLLFWLLDEWLSDMEPKK